MGQVTVRINNREYQVTCGPGEEERITGLAGYVDGKVQELVGRLGNVGDQRLLVMSNLMLADELWELRENGSAPSEGADHDRAGMAASIEALADRLDRLAETLEAADGS